MYRLFHFPAQTRPLGARVGNWREPRALHRDARGVSQLKNIRPNQPARFRIHHAWMLRERQPLGRPFRVDLEGVRLKFKAKLRLKLADGG
jgi:hypothetical protein